MICLIKKKKKERKIVKKNEIKIKTYIFSYLVK